MVYTWVPMCWCHATDMDAKIEKLVEVVCSCENLSDDLPVLPRLQLTVNHTQKFFWCLQYGAALQVPGNDGEALVTQVVRVPDSEIFSRN